jgi:hypothetical protein
VGLLNVDGYYDFLLTFIDKAVDDEFIKPSQRHIFVSAPNAKELVQKLEVCVMTINVMKIHENNNDNIMLSERNSTVYHFDAFLYIFCKQWFLRFPSLCKFQDYVPVSDETTPKVKWEAEQQQQQQQPTQVGFNALQAEIALVKWWKRWSMMICRGKWAAKMSLWSSLFVWFWYIIDPLVWSSQKNIFYGGG